MWRKLFERNSVMPVLLVLAGVLLFCSLPRPTLVQRLPIPGLSHATVDLILGRSMTGEYRYIVRFGDSETKQPFVPGDVSVEEFRANTHVTYVNRTLKVYGPRGKWLEVSEFRP